MTVVMSLRSRCHVTGVTLGRMISCNIILPMWYMSCIDSLRYMSSNMTRVKTALPCAFWTYSVAWNEISPNCLTKVAWIGFLAKLSKVKNTEALRLQNNKTSVHP